eukprot:CAMPEP_0194482150 /NCGR_PEP_ID=MMETSP0253-20130528/4235_1 /TAXON_ID=2966 /ORGANISM="Noctiluca scintillans" /LENGTH=688 /DNA_ID=CAMNT_0039321673 /DNA_START=47 /DNA_END=2116 /DNA_ORIENTATION=+
MSILKVVLGLCAGVTVAQVNPVSQVIGLLQDLHTKVSADAAAEVLAFKAYSSWCTEKAKDDGHQQETLNANIASTKAAIENDAAQVESIGADIASLATGIASSDNELSAATVVRTKEETDYSRSEAELVDVVDTLERAISIIQREMAKNPAFLQKKIDTRNMNNVISALSAVVDAAAFSSADKQKLVALVQSRQASDDGDSEFSAPAAAAYASHSSDIVDVLNDLLDKAQTQLDETRHAESNAAHNFALLRQSLEDQLAQDNKALEKAKADRAEFSTALAAEKADLAESEKSLTAVEASQAASKSSCAQVASDHEVSVAAFEAELKAMAEATQVLQSETGGAEGQTYSLFQVISDTGLRTTTDLKGFEVVMMVRRLAQKEHSAALAQLASRISAVMKFGAGAGEDPFLKVKDLITDLITRLQAESSSETSHKSYCDEEMAKSAEKKEDLEAEFAKHSSKLEAAVAKSNTLDAEVSELQADLGALSSQQLKMDMMRADERKIFGTAKEDLEQGIAGIQKAMGILREYYGASFVQQPVAPEVHQSSGGAASSIIGILEVIEADFSKNLAELSLAEEEGESSYQKLTQTNHLAKVSKEQDVKYKQEESTNLKRSSGELTSDRDSTSAELSAVVQYLAKLNEMCVAKAETYSERASRRMAEIAGLKEALSILSEGALLQSSGALHIASVHRH